MTSNAPILAVGSIAFDSISTPAGKVDEALGGSVNYFSIAASFFSPVFAVGVVGSDFPKAHLEWLKKRNIDISGIQIANGKTFRWAGEYNDDLNEAKTLSTFLNVFETFKPELNTEQRKSPYVFLANIDPDLQLSLLDQVASPRLVACDTMNFWITGKLNELKRVLKRVDVFSINEGEAYLLSQQNSLVRAAKKIQEMGPSSVIIKRGEYGATLFSGKEVFLLPAFPVADVIDPTGAGDTFAGGFMGALAQAKIDRRWSQSDPAKFQSTLREAMIRGNILASFAVEDFGIGRLAKLTSQEIDRRHGEFESMLRTST